MRYNVKFLLLRLHLNSTGPLPDPISVLLLRKNLISLEYNYIKNNILRIKNVRNFKVLKDFPKHLEATLHHKPNSINYYALLGESDQLQLPVAGSMCVHL